MAIEVVGNPDDADFFIDDIVDSGATREKWKQEFPETPFFALIDKTDPESPISEFLAKVTTPLQLRNELSTNSNVIYNPPKGL